ncbi:MAG: LysM peptidoglycan-binding domain-containing protein, partial [Chloroflexi bacterium]|nr:LysM peptidoglycan-binding domain-containing protein [Chloroflexota bacterium]
AANPGVNANFIYPGQVLKIPSANAPAPAITPGASGPTPVAGLPSTYTVQRGDWLYAIARKFGVSVVALQNVNPGINFNVLTPGMVLRIPGGAPSPSTSTTPTTSNPNSYTVKSGDTLFSIAVRFSTTTYALQIANNLSNSNFIYVGQVLVLPK